MSRLYVYQKIEKLVRRHGTRDPFELLDAMHVQVRFYYDLTPRPYRASRAGAQDRAPFRYGCL